MASQAPGNRLMQARNIVSMRLIYADDGGDDIQAVRLTDLGKQLEIANRILHVHLGSNLRLIIPSRNVVFHGWPHSKTSDLYWLNMVEEAQS